ncbi:MAG: BLUF domain-containing protein [Burkholderiaceae bacterium]
MSSPSVIVYRSRAVFAESDVDLFYLLAQARERNEFEGITGLLLYDRGHFYQWIEGEAPSLAPVWDSIRRDWRHTDIEVLADREIPFRLFTEWTMQFAHRDKAFLRLMDGFVEADPLLLEALHTSPETAPRILASFSRFDRFKTAWPI